MTSHLSLRFTITRPEGCGDGRVLIAMAKKYPWLRCEGYEINEAVHAEAVQNVRKAGLAGVVLVHLDTAYSAPVSTADIVYAYSNKRGLNQLHSLLNKIKPGARLVLYQNDVKSPLAATRVRCKCVDPKNNLVVWPVYVHTFHGDGASSNSLQRQASSAMGLKMDEVCVGVPLQKPVVATTKNLTIS